MKIRNIILVLFGVAYSGQIAHAENDYDVFKYQLQKTYNFDYGIDVSVLEQRSSPNGKNNAVQLYIYPYFTWKIIDNENGSGILNLAYSIVRYGRHNGSDLAENSGFAVGLNDYTTDLNQFAELYYEHHFKAVDWLSLGVGQFPIYNFDGTEYNSNQQVNFLNDALSQNASSTYALSGVGGYAKVNLNTEFTFVVGGQDGTNIDGKSIRFNHLTDGHYTTFGYMEYATKIFENPFEISLLLYNQPYVHEQLQTTNGWSFNLAQDIGDKFSIFARVNGVSGDVSTIRQSWVLGGVYNNPINRNELDQIGVAYAYNKIDENAIGEYIYNEAEQVVEVYWSIGIGKWFILTPDVQFYFNPVLNRKSDFGMATSLRATLFL